MAKYNARIEVTKEIDVWFEVPLFTGDVGNDIRLSFYENGQAYDMNGAQVTALRADGEAVYDVAATEGNEAIITLKNNCYTQPGELSVFVTLTDAAGRAVTNGVLHFDVRRGYADEGGITADDRYPVLTGLINEVEELAELCTYIDLPTTTTLDIGTPGVYYYNTQGSFAGDVNTAILIVTKIQQTVDYPAQVLIEGGVVKSRIKTDVAQPDGTMWTDWKTIGDETGKAVSVTIAPSGGRGDYVCTGANDNLVIQQALNAATENGTKAATVVLMPGEYSISDGFTIPSSVTLSGYGAQLIVADVFGVSASLISVGNGVRIIGLTIIGEPYEDGTNNIPYQSAITKITGKGNDLVIEDCQITCHDDGISLSSTSNLRVSHCKFFNSGDNIKLNNVANAKLESNSMESENYCIYTTGGECFCTGNDGTSYEYSTVYSFGTGTFHPATTTNFNDFNTGGIVIRP